MSERSERILKAAKGDFETFALVFREEFSASTKQEYDPNWIEKLRAGRMDGVKVLYP